MGTPRPVLLRGGERPAGHDDEKDRARLVMRGADGLRSRLAGLSPRRECDHHFVRAPGRAGLARRRAEHPDHGPRQPARPEWEATASADVRRVAFRGPELRRRRCRLRRRRIARRPSSGRGRSGHGLLDPARRLCRSAGLSRRAVPGQGQDRLPAGVRSCRSAARGQSSDGSGWWSEPRADRADEQQAREAGRRAQIPGSADAAGHPHRPLRRDRSGRVLRGGPDCRSDHGVSECRHAPTRPYSGADFGKGVQQIDAAQALAFVRQRRDVNDQIVHRPGPHPPPASRSSSGCSAPCAAKRAPANPQQLRDLLAAARRNIAVDSGLDLATMVRSAGDLAGRAVRLYTLPINEFRTLSDGEDVNIVDPATIRSDDCRTVVRRCRHR